MDNQDVRILLSMDFNKNLSNFNQLHSVTEEFSAVQPTGSEMSINTTQQERLSNVNTAYGHKTIQILHISGGGTRAYSILEVPRSQKVHPKEYHIFF